LEKLKRNWNDFVDGCWHWRRHRWGTGAPPPSSSNCWIFRVTSKPSKL